MQEFSNPCKSSQDSLGITFYNELQQKNSTKTVIIETTNEEITYGEFLNTSIGLAKKLKACGVEKNNVITIISHNHWKYLATIVAGFYVGASVNLLNFDYTARELKQLLSVCKPKIIFCTKNSFKNLQLLQEETFFPKTIISFDAQINSSTTSFDEFLQDQDDNLAFEPTLLNPREDVALILTSSGTTGFPKCVQLTHTNSRIFLDIAGNSDWIDITDADSTIGFLPFFHVFGIGVALSSILHGSKLVILEKFYPEQFLWIIEKHKITKLFVVPPILLFLVKSPLVQKYDLSSVEAILFAAAPASKELSELVEKRLKISRLCNMYGMTELSGVMVVTPKNGVKYGSCGKVTDAFRSKVCDIETGKSLPPYQKGELRFKGDGVMKGYLGCDEETKNAFDDDGYLKTGDVGFYDEDGYIYVVDRLKEIIKYKGFQVSPTELETTLIQHPSVKDAGVVGIPDERAGEVPVALVVKQPSHNITENELIKYVSENLAVQKHLHGGLKFVEEIPKNSSGKILRRKLKELL